MISEKKWGQLNHAYTLAVCHTHQNEIIFTTKFSKNAKGEEFYTGLPLLGGFVLSV